MISPLLLMVSCLRAAVAPTPPAGPPAPILKGLRRPLPLAAQVTDYVRASLKDLPGAVVVVEEDALPPLAPLRVPVTLFGGRLRLGSPVEYVKGAMPVLPWMDAGTTVRSGGNVVAKTYPMGWGN